MVLHRYGFKEEAKKIIHQLKETSVESKENGMYWKNNLVGWNWQDTPVETQTLIIEAFNEITPEDLQSIEAMKIWLIKQKQNQQWNTTKSTTEAIYALLHSGKSWKNIQKGVAIESQFKIPDNSLTESGRISATIKAQNISSAASSVTISKESAGIALGGLYWQYFENIDNISSSENGISIQKELYIIRNTKDGEELQKITSQTPIKIGDKVAIRILISNNKNLEFVHLKDMRASGFEPTSVLSEYKYKNGLSYYTSTKDASTNFFFDELPKGNYVLEYKVIANNAGSFSNGISTIQGMYAPELSAHTKGINITIKE